jgi:uncharacterized membrane protein
MRLLTRISILILFLTASPVIAFPITEYDTRMDVQKDSSVIVTESITADFTGDPHHGIYRDIPLSGTDRYGNKYQIRHELISISDKAGNPQTYVQSVKNGTMSIRIGDADVLLNGITTYVIKYKLWRAIHFFNDYDELYWNAVGHEWEVPIQHATCIVTLPKDVKTGEIRTVSYTGAYGSTTSDALSDTPNNHTARFWMNRELNPGEFMTIVVGWPKGAVTQPKISQEMNWFIFDNGYFFLPPFFMLGLWLVWLRAGRDPDTGKSEVVSYDPPDNMSPAEIGTLIDEKVDMRDISASIIDLAVRGIIKIESEKVKGFISTKTEYTLRLTSSYTETRKNTALSSFDRLLIQALFNGLGFCIVSQLSGRFYGYLPMLRDSLYNSMIDRRYFNRRPDEVRQGYQIAGVMLAFAGIFGGIILAISNEIPAAVNIPVGWAFAAGLCGIVLAITSRAMPRKTKKGKDALLAVKGFEEYISRAERAEIESQERQGYFEKYLPYAMALGVADKWAQAFNGLQTEPPKWYDGYDGTFHPTILAHDLSAATNDWNGIMSTQPRTTSSGNYGSSGSSGGSDFFSGGSGFSDGFSGGGGGGGGGGGW